MERYERELDRRTLPALRNIPVPMVPPIAGRKEGLDDNSTTITGVHTNHCEMPTLHRTLCFIRGIK